MIGPMMSRSPSVFMGMRSCFSSVRCCRARLAECARVACVAREAACGMRGMCDGARRVDNVHDKHPQLPFRDAHRRADSINTIYQLRWGKGDGRRGLASAEALRPAIPFTPTPGAIAFPSTRDAGRALYCSGIFNISSRALRTVAHCDGRYHLGFARRRNKERKHVIDHRRRSQKP